MLYQKQPTRKYCLDGLDVQVPAVLYEWNNMYLVWKWLEHGEVEFVHVEFWYEEVWHGATPWRVPRNRPEQSRVGPSCWDYWYFSEMNENWDVNLTSAVVNNLRKQRPVVLLIQIRQTILNKYKHISVTVLKELGNKDILPVERLVYLHLLGCLQWSILGQCPSFYTCWGEMLAVELAKRHGHRWTRGETH